MLLGGSQLRTVDFDSGLATVIPQPRLLQGEYVVDFRTASRTYAVVTRCEAAPTRTLRIGADGAISDVTLPGSVDTVLAEGAESPSLAFSADGRWLVIALDAGSNTRLLAWRSGLAHPYETTPIAGQGLGPAPMAALPLHGDN